MKSALDGELSSEIYSPSLLIRGKWYKYRLTGSWSVLHVNDRDRYAALPPSCSLLSHPRILSNTTSGTAKIPWCLAANVLTCQSGKNSGGYRPWNSLRAAKIKGNFYLSTSWRILFVNPPFYTGISVEAPPLERCHVFRDAITSQNVPNHPKPPVPLSEFRNIWRIFKV